MDTFRFWFEDDKEIPRFKRLMFEKVPVSLADVLKKGIHPWQGPNTHKMLGEKFTQVLNSDEFKLPEIAQFDYCGDISHSTYKYSAYQESPFEDTLRRVSEGVYFVESLSYAELLEMAKERLREMWSHRVAKRLLSSVYYGFDAMRTFLKTKDKGLKLSGYVDFENYDLGRVLRLEDFETEDSILISQGMSLTNFRLMNILEQITEQRGLLRLTKEIRDFQITIGKDRFFGGNTVVFNCRRTGDAVRFRPKLDKKYDKRQLVLKFAPCWRIDNGRYCFTTNVDRVSTMIQEKWVEISFPALDYMNQGDADTSFAGVSKSKVERYSVGKHINCNASCGDLRTVLRNHSVSMTGRKEMLLGKLAELSVRFYKEREKELDAYFGRYRFIQVPDDNGRSYNIFPLLEGLDLQNMVLTMYIIKHLRANAILEASHNNDTFDLAALARALIRKEVSHNGSFLMVE